MAFLLDCLADAAVEGAPGGAEAADGGGSAAPLPRPLAEWLNGRVQVGFGRSGRHRPAASQAEALLCSPHAIA